MPQKYVLAAGAWYFFFTPNHPRDPEQYLKTSLLDLGHPRVNMHLIQDASQLWLVEDARAYALEGVHAQIKNLQSIVLDDLQLPDLDSPLLSIETCIIVDCEKKKALILRVYDPKFVSADMLPQNYPWEGRLPAKREAVQFIGDVTRTEIQGGDTLRVAEAVVGCIERYKTTRKLDLIMFGIAGYDEDRRALFDIPDVRKWAHLLHTEIPFVLDLVDPITYHWLLPCIADIEVTDRTSQNTVWKFREEPGRNFVKQMFSARAKLFANLAASQDEFDNLADGAFDRFKSAMEGTSPAVKMYDQILSSPKKTSKPLPWVCKLARQLVSSIRPRT